MALEPCRSSDAEARDLQMQFDAERTELSRQAAVERNAVITSFDATEVHWLREIDESFS